MQLKKYELNAHLAEGIGLELKDLYCVREVQKITNNYNMYLFKTVVTKEVQMHCCLVHCYERDSWKGGREGKDKGKTRKES